MTLTSNFKNTISQWNYVYIFVFMSAVFLLLSGTLINLQVVESGEYSDRAASNQIVMRYEYPNRGVIFDRNGNKLAENIPASNLILELDYYLHGIEIDRDRLSAATEMIIPIIGDSWRDGASVGEGYSSLDQYIVSKFEEETIVSEFGYVSIPSELQIAYGLNNDQSIKIKTLKGKVEGIKLEESTKRYYSSGEAFTHILGYTSLIIAEDLEDKEYLGYQDGVAGNGYRDLIGRLGVEAVYDEELIGNKGIYAIEIDAFGNPVSDVEREFSKTESGKNLHLSIDSGAQQKMFEIVEKYVDRHNATGGAGIVQDVNSGELLVIVTTPSYDNNSFVGGISSEEYDQLLSDARLPLFNRSISAQLPPGSTFKTLGGVAAYDAGAIDLNTEYLSRRGYTFSNGAPFQEYQNLEYGTLTLKEAIQRSSNIFFCETIRNWDINELVPYYEDFGIGSYTGVDLIGEGAGRLPSPENKAILANTPGITWLDPIWYPEGDGCNTIIGQGITLVTPLQMSNWIAAIANGGTLNTPHLGVKLTDQEGNEEIINHEPLNKDFIKGESLAVMRESMRLAVDGPLRSVYALTDAKSEVAAKTGTAEFGALNADGVYEHTHAWVTGFFPYEDPQYSFVILLEDGGQSYYAAEAAREFIDWWVVEGPGVN